jgi:regulator of protease activity HflC (stomatin/prohibitin superfamily)
VIRPQVAEQDAERARFVVLKAEQERNAAIIRAEGESESAKLISEATKARSGRVILLEGSSGGCNALSWSDTGAGVKGRAWNAVVGRAGALPIVRGCYLRPACSHPRPQVAGPGLIELRRIEAAKDIADTMSRSQNVVYLPSGGNMLLGINPR